jgi:hypothetical protein
MSLRGSLTEHAACVALIDTHEHVRLEPAAPWGPGLWGLLTGPYVYATFHLAGAPLDAFAQRPATVEEEWAVFAPYLPAVQTTCYFRHTWEGVRTALGVQMPELTREFYAETDRRLKAAQAQPGWGKRLLQETARIDRALLDTFWDPAALDADSDLFDPVLRVNGFVMCPWEGSVDHNENSYWRYLDLLEVEITDFSSFLGLFDAMLDRHCRAGAKAIKLALAYDRRLEFLPVDRATAERIWLAGPHGATPDEQTALQDYLCYYTVGEAARRGLPVQIHTGILEGLRNYQPAHVSPTLLVPLITAFPEARFDLFHAGFPYARELSVMALEFPNVWADICWVPLVSEGAAVQILEEWIEMLPGNKILWGSDCLSPVTTLGATIFGRRVVVEAVARRAEAGALSEKQARRLVEGILRENAQALFHEGR